MRTLMAVVALVVGMAFYAALPVAAENKADEKGAVGLAERMQDLNLTDQQEAKITDIRKEFKPKVQEAAKDLAAVVKEEVEKVHGVLTPEQRKKLEEAKDERKELRAERLPERLAQPEGTGSHRRGGGQDHGDPQGVPPQD